MDKSSATINCPFCEIEIDSYENHEKPKATSKELYSCNNCDLKIYNNECLQRHNKIVHAIPQVFSCEMCNIDFSARKYLYLHKSFNHTFDESLEYEKIKVEEETQEEPFDVKVETQDSNELDKDVQANEVKTDFNQAHSVIRSLRCDLCNGTFKNISNLNSHIRCVHENARNFQCEECNKTFNLILRQFMQTLENTNVINVTKYTKQAMF